MFALGALGTGVFLFVNTLVGGLLTLAAPILALLLRGRVSGEIKAASQARAAEMVRQDRRRGGPQVREHRRRLPGRLAEFVTAAGEALHKGIGEVLDRALAERRNHGVDVEVRDEEIAAQLARLAQIETRMTGLRERLWAPPPAPSVAEPPPGVKPSSDAPN